MKKKPNLSIITLTPPVRMAFCLSGDCRRHMGCRYGQRHSFHLAVSLCRRGEHRKSGREPSHVSTGFYGSPSGWSLSFACAFVKCIQLEVQHLSRPASRNGFSIFIPCMFISERLQACKGHISMPVAFIIYIISGTGISHPFQRLQTGRTPQSCKPALVLSIGMDTENIPEFFPWICRITDTAAVR